MGGGTSRKTAASPDDGAEYIYHERQRDSLCGMHAVNNLLQRRAVTPRQLRRIARRLDEAERRLMERRRRRKLLRAVTCGQAGLGAEEPGNCGRGGDFSFQVLEAALLEHGVLLLPLRGSGAMEAWGCIVWCADHWVAYRRVQVSEESIWLDFNSTLRRPRALSPSQVKRLEAGLSPAKGGVVFAAVGDPPPSPPPLPGRGGGGGSLVQLKLRAERVTV
mmetsp:Transcript_111427/g.240067  ORF Transcript_111427/g.240067 Transcript_111427/m.240067 type:complete len:219 (+) Transcript_111427:89-745(+)